MNDSGGAGRYSASLDGLRAIAALLIVLYHAPIPGFSGGFFAVDIFFVLSGYLITGLLLDEYRRNGRIHYGRFVMRRVRRLAPALLFMLLGYLALAPVFFVDAPWSKHLIDAFWAALYLVNYVAMFHELLAVLGHVWSLAVEMQFYLVWPILMAFLVLRSRRFLIFVLVVLYAAATVWRGWSVGHDADMWSFYTRTDGHCSGLLLGALVASLNLKLHRYWFLLAILALMFAMSFFSSRWLPTAQYGFTIAEVAAALLLMSRPEWLGGMWLAWLGRMSYGIYLWHYLIAKICSVEGLDWAWVLLLSAGGGLIMAVVSHYFVERRFYRPRFVWAEARSVAQ